MKTVIKVLEAKYNDSMEDWILDDMIQSTLLEFFNWQECCGKGADVQFIQTWDTKSDYYPKVIIEAQFSNKIGRFLPKKHYILYTRR